MSQTQDPTEGQEGAPAQPSFYGQAVRTYAPMAAKHLARVAANGVVGSMGMPPFSGGQPPRSVSQTQAEGRNAARRGRRPRPGSNMRDPTQTEPGTLPYPFPRPPSGEEPPYERPPPGEEPPYETPPPPGEEPLYEAPGEDEVWDGVVSSLKGWDRARGCG